MKIIENLTNVFENPLVNITFLCGFLFIIAGYILLKFPPKNINSLYGYRTSSGILHKTTPLKK